MPTIAELFANGQRLRDKSRALQSERQNKMWLNLTERLATRVRLAKRLIENEESKLRK